MTSPQDPSNRRPSHSDDALADRPDDALHLRMGSEGVSYAAFFDAGQTFARLVRAVAAEVTGTNNSVQLIIEKSERGSVDLSVRCEPRVKRVSRRQAAEVPAIVAAGIEQIKRGGDRPPFFSDQALRLTSDLAKFQRSLPIRIAHGLIAADLGPDVVASAERMLIEEAVSEWGTVEGRLEALTVHRRRTFVIWDVLTNDRVECDFGYRIAVEDIGRATEKRVAVSGEITYDADGRVKSVRADEMFVFPDEADLPSADDVLGILSD